MSANNDQTRLYLCSPPLVLDQIQPLAQLLDQLSSRLDIACINLLFGDSGSGQSLGSGKQQLQSLIEAMQKKNIAVLVDVTSSQYTLNRKSFEKALENVKILGCDGLHLSADTGLYQRARDVLGVDAIVGVDCGTSRHAGMQLGEIGANYVGFRSIGRDASRDGDGPAHGQDKVKDHDLDIGTLENDLELFEPETIVELVEWWQQLFEVPCVALDVSDRGQIADLQQVNADFVAIGSSMWSTLEEDAELLNWLTERFPIAGTNA